MEALDRPPVVEPPDTDLGTWSIETDPATGWKVGDLLQSPLPDRPRLEGDGEIHVGLEFGPEGIPVTILLDSSSSAPEILDCLRTFIARWRIRPDLAPCSGTVHLRPPLPIGEEAP
jgi:hypothetical protein